MDAHTGQPARGSSIGSTPIPVIGIALLAFTLLAASGAGGFRFEAAGWSLAALAHASWAPAVCLAGAVGLGRLARPIFARSAQAWPLQVGAGLSLHLTACHLLGQLGLISGPIGTASAVTLNAVGIFLLLQQWSHASEETPRGGRSSRLSWKPGAASYLAAVPLAVLALASAQPPGLLWDSEFGGFDSLSYHLQLPQEWFAMGRIAPLDHNVYSYLPSYMESAFVHLAALTRASAPGSAGEEAFGLLSGGGWRLLSCQALHAGYAVLGAWAVMRAAGSLLSGTAIGSSVGRWAWAATIATPWVLVVGSLSYNEMGVVALGALGIAAAADPALAVWRRAALAGLMVGVACGVKPTAILMVAPAVAVVLLSGLPGPATGWSGRALSRVALSLAAGGAAGGAALVPWMVRNWSACGNPVFPYAAGWFGTGRWDAEQVERYRAGHAFEGGLAERLTAALGTERGLLHPQWGLLVPMAVLGVVLLLRSRETRRAGAVLGAATLASLAGWFLFTHVQSRFVLGALPVLGVAAGCVPALAWAGGRRGAAAAATLALAVQSVWCAAVFMHQAGRGPTALAGINPSELAGAGLRRVLGASPAAERMAFFAEADPTRYINLGLPAGSVVYLLGDSTPLYFTVPVVYHTTWDASPLGGVMRALPGSPREMGGGWLSALRARGVTHVLVNYGELARLERSGWYDPMVTPGVVWEVMNGWAATVKAWGAGGGRGAGSPPRQVLYRIDGVGADRPALVGVDTAGGGA